MDQQNTTLNSTPTPPAKPALRLIKQAFGYMVALACLVWVFHDIHFGKLLRHMTNINWGWVALAIVFDILSYFCQGLRWQLLLRPIGTISSLRATQAIYAGLFTNEVLPMRFGELVRAYLISRWVSAEFVSVIPSMAVERLFDGVWLALAIGLVAIFVALPKDLVEAGDILGIIVLLATGLFVYVVFRKEKAILETSRKSYTWTPLRLVMSVVERMAGGLRDIGMSRFIYMAFIFSVFTLIFQIVAFWLIVLAYGLGLSFWIGAVVFLIVHLGTAIPNAPSNVGTYQFFCVIGLALFGVEKTLATGFSVVVFVLLTIPLWVIGMFALSRTGMSLTSIRNEINRLLQKTKTKNKYEE